MERGSMGVRRPAARIAAGGVGTALAALGLVTAAAQSAGATPASNCTGSGVVTCTFTSVDLNQSFLVPDGVVGLTIKADGAPGGNTQYGSGGRGQRLSGMCQ